MELQGKEKGQLSLALALGSGDSCCYWRGSLGMADLRSNRL